MNCEQCKRGLKFLFKRCIKKDLFIPESLTSIILMLNFFPFGKTFIHCNKYVYICDYTEGKAKVLGAGITVPAYNLLGRSAVNLWWKLIVILAGGLHLY